MNTFDLGRSANELLERTLPFKGAVERRELIFVSLVKGKCARWVRV